MKKVIALVLALLLVLSLAACSNAASSETSNTTEETTTTTEEEPTTTTEETTTADDITPTDDNPVIYLNGEYAAVSGNILLTSIGQSADFDTMSALLKKAGAPDTITENATATADDLTGIDVVIIATGSSTKGLGAAGISTEDEMARGEALLEACKSAGIKVILTHIGGEARRGSLSDQFIELVMDYAEDMIVVAEGNSDGLFSDFCATNSIPLVLVKSMSNAVEPLSKLFA